MKHSTVSCYDQCWCVCQFSPLVALVQPRPAHRTSPSALQHSLWWRRPWSDRRKLGHHQWRNKRRRKEWEDVCLFCAQLLREHKQQTWQDLSVDFTQYPGLFRGTAFGYIRQHLEALSVDIRAKVEGLFIRRHLVSLFSSYHLGNSDEQWLNIKTERCTMWHRISIWSCVEVKLTTDSTSSSQSTTIWPHWNNDTRRRSKHV